MRRVFTGVVGALVVGALVMGAGCGSGGSGPAALVGEPGVGSPQETGSLHVAVRFPPCSGVTPQGLPAAASSVRIIVIGIGDQTVADVCLQRPAGNGGTVSTTITDVPAGDNIVTVAAYASADCSGTPVAFALETVTVVAGQTNTVTIVTQPTVITGTVDSSIVRITVGETADVQTQWFDIDGNEAMPVGVTWSSSDETVATVAPDVDDSRQATITGIGVGNCLLTATSSPDSQVQPAQGPSAVEVQRQVLIDVTVYETGGLEVIVE